MKLLIDMDGTLCEWRVGKESELLKKGYFASLQPLPTVDTVRSLCHKFDVYILSAVMPESLFAEQEKRDWINRYLPEIQEDHILFSVNGQSKREFIKEKFGSVSKTDFLLDDYSKNLKDWQKEGTAVKVFNGINGNNGTIYSFYIHANQDPIKNAKKLENFIS